MPGHLRICYPVNPEVMMIGLSFVFLSLNLLIYPGRGGEIVKNLLCITMEVHFWFLFRSSDRILGQEAIKFAGSKHLIDGE